MTFNNTSSSGFISLDFIAAMVINFILITVLIVMAVSFSIVEVVQYVSFATARSYIGANSDIENQKNIGLQKFQSLIETNALDHLIFNSNWYDVNEPIFGDFNNEYPEENRNMDFNAFVGARIPLSLNILVMSVPFLGSTASNNSTGQAMVASYLNREVSDEECRDGFNRERMTAFLDLDGAYQLPYLDYVLISDNGC